MQENNIETNEEHERGVEQLAELMRQAGEEARARRAKAFATHFQMLKAAVAEGASRRKHHGMGLLKMNEDPIVEEVRKARDEYDDVGSGCGGS